MSLETRLQGLISAIGADIAALINSRGTLASLSTTAKGNLVAAINEVFTMAESAAGGGAVISDGTTTTTSVWSSQKVADELTARVAALVNSAPGALDTLGELATELQNQGSAAAALTTAVGNRIRYDAAQSLTSPQQDQACTNAGAVRTTAIGNADADLVALYTAAKA